MQRSESSQRRWRALFMVVAQRSGERFLDFARNDGGGIPGWVPGPPGRVDAIVISTGARRRSGEISLRFQAPCTRASSLVMVQRSGERFLDFARNDGGGRKAVRLVTVRVSGKSLAKSQIGSGRRQFGSIAVDWQMLGMSMPVWWTLWSHRNRHFLMEQIQDNRLRRRLIAVSSRRSFGGQTSGARKSTRDRRQVCQIGA